MRKTAHEYLRDGILFTANEMKKSLEKNEIAKSAVCGLVLALLNKLSDTVQVDLGQWGESQGEEEPHKEPISKDGLRPKPVDVFLKDTGGAEVAIVRALRSETEMSIKEIESLVRGSKDLPVLKNISFSKAQKILELLKESGATVELRTSG